MSGGHFDYKQFVMEDIATEIEWLIETNNNTERDEWGYTIGNNYPKEIITRFKETVYILRQSREMVQRIDYLVSGDDGEESFISRWDKEVKELI